MSRKGTLFIDTSLTENLSTVPTVILSTKKYKKININSIMCICFGLTYAISVVIGRENHAARAKFVHN